MGIFDLQKGQCPQCLGMGSVDVPGGRKLCPDLLLSPREQIPCKACGGTGNLEIAWEKGMNW